MIKKCPIGEMRHLIDIEKPTASGQSPDIGGHEVTWSAHVAGVYARIDPIQGQEYEISEQVKAGVLYEVEIRFCEGTTEKMRIKFGTRYLQIEAVLDVDERNDRMLLAVSEWKAGA